MSKKETCSTCGKYGYSFLHSCPGVPQKRIGDEAWCINGRELLNALLRVRAGERPELVYVELTTTARLVTEAVAGERERVAAAIEALVCPGSPPAPLAKYAYEPAKEHAAAIARTPADNAQGA